MTKKTATELAKKALRYGHFARGRDAYVRCPHPLCTGRDQHDAEMYYPTNGGKLTQTEMVKQLTARVLDCEMNHE